MTDERKYSEKEIADIFKRASEDQEKIRALSAKEEGLSLTELLVIGSESGIDPELIKRAAVTIDDSTPEAVQSTFLGIRTGVARTVDLHGPLSDDDWNRLVLEMRETFHAHGKIESVGAFRSWRNGNLQISVEPTPAGDRLRMRTRKSNAQASILSGMAAIGVALAIIMSFVFGGGFDGTRISLVTMMIAAGLGIFAFMALQLPRWATERERQMDALAERASGFAATSRQKKLPRSSEQQLPVLDELPDATQEEEETSVPSRNRDRI